MEKLIMITFAVH